MRILMISENDMRMTWTQLMNAKHLYTLKTWTQTDSGKNDVWSHEDCVNSEYIDNSNGQLYALGQ